MRSPMQLPTPDESLEGNDKRYKAGRQDGYREGYNAAIIECEVLNKQFTMTDPHAETGLADGEREALACAALDAVVESDRENAVDDAAVSPLSPSTDSPQPKAVDEDSIALAAARDIRDIPTDLPTAQYLARIQLRVLAALRSDFAARTTTPSAGPVVLFGEEDENHHGQ